MEYCGFTKCVYRHYQCNRPIFTDKTRGFLYQAGSAPHLDELPFVTGQILINKSLAPGRVADNCKQTQKFVFSTNFQKVIIKRVLAATYATSPKAAQSFRNLLDDSESCAASPKAARWLRKFTDDAESLHSHAEKKRAFPKIAMRPRKENRSFRKKIYHPEKKTSLYENLPMTPKNCTAMPKKKRAFPKITSRPRKENRLFRKKIYHPEKKTEPLRKFTDHAESVC